jgi:O-antigen/teichoic acid export membrane protein
MSTIRKQSIISSLVVYLGFALGFFNTYLFTREGGFTKEEYGLISFFIAFANIMYSVANLGMVTYIHKFFPYYKDRLPREKNDMLTIALVISTMGFLMMTVVGFLFKDILIDKIYNNSPGIVQYYYWIFIFGFGLTLFSIFEAYSWQQGKAVLTNFSKEVLFRILITILILLATVGLIRTFDLFIKLYSFLYLFIALVVAGYFILQRRLHLTATVSTLTRRLSKKIVTLVSFVWGGQLIYTVSNVFDSIVLAAVMPNGLAFLGIFTLAQNISSLIQAPQRGIISSSVGPLSQAWKDKDFVRINRIYHRSSINQLIFSAGMFMLIWLNFDDAISTFRFQQAYAEAKWAFFFLGISKIIDMGTGVNSQIIGTSTHWRFEFLSGLLLLTLALPLNFILTRQMGLVGPAVSNLIAFSCYNFIRYWFLLKRFQMQPFNKNTVYTVLLAVGCYYASFFLFRNQQGLLSMTLRSLLFLILFGIGVIKLNLTPDLGPVLHTLRKRLHLKL